MKKVASFQPGRRQGLAALMLAIGAVLAFGSLAMGVHSASAHHNEYDAHRACDGSWDATGLYVGGENERLVILSGVVINGVPFDGSWSGGLLTPYNPATHGQTSTVVGTPAYAWRGVSNGFTLFNRSGTNFVGGPANWTGTLYIFGPDQDNPSIWSMTRPAVTVFEPDGPTNCMPSETPTPPPTTPPCYPPDSKGTPPAGATQCTPTPAPPTSTPPGTPPCYPPGTMNPPDGAKQCTPTPPPPVNTVAGVKTPGPGVPSAGMGLSTDMSSTNMLFALLGLLAVSGGAALLALGRAPAED